MKNENNRYLYVTGIATGLIMALLSMGIAFKMVGYVERGGSYLSVIAMAIIVALMFCVAITFAVEKIIK
ncbi:MAG: hypothetical protein PHR00_01825 [Patescibacteria group bacterium]|nr:hypothetical protein [Patescibacteria group bacterium]